MLRNKILVELLKDMSNEKYNQKFKRTGKKLTTEQKIENFIIRNSKNGFFTKVKTIPFKFEISENKTWDIVGDLLGKGNLEATHDEFTGDMKLCEIGKTYEIMDLEKRRKAKKIPAKRKFKQKKSQFKNKPKNSESKNS